MPRITSITLKGFKSFGKRASVEFPVEFSVIVGRNGSGKSNIVDALCFVLGTARSKVMRVKSSSELIFNGGKAGPPGEAAEVAIVFDNSDARFRIDSGSVTLSRTVKSSGVSTYRLNGKVVTRQEVLEALSHARINPDSYNIVLQNDVARVIEMSPLQRRGYIDEIAGIASYEERKERALGELASADQRLGEVQVKLGEMRRFLDEMREERDKALKLRELRGERALVEATLCRSRARRDGERLERERKGIAGLEEQRAARLALRAQEEGTLAATRSRLAEVERRLQVEGYGDQVRLAERRATINGDARLLKERQKGAEDRLAAAQERVKGLTMELAENSAGLGRSKKELAELAAEEQRLGEEQAGLERKLRRERKAVDEEWAALEKEREGLDRELSELGGRASAAREELARIQATLGSTTGKRLRLDELRTEQASLKREEAELIAEVNARGEEASLVVRELADTRRAMEKREHELAQVRERLERAARTTPEVEAVLKAGLEGVVGRVFDLVEFAPEHAAAVMAAAGPRMNAVVVERDVHAVACVNFLKSKRIGRARFLPLDKLRGAPPSKEAEAVGRQALGLLRDHVRFEPHLEPVIRYLFGNTVLVETIEHARAIGFGRARMVSLDGDLAEPSGAVVGGHNRTERITVDVGALRAELERLLASVGAMESRKDDLERELIERRQRRAEVRVRLQTVEADLRDLEGVDAAKLEEREGELERELRSLDGNLERRRAKLSEVQARLAATNKQELAESLEREEARLRELGAALSDVKSRRAAKEEEKRHRYEGNIENYKGTLREEQKAAESHRQELGTLQSQLSQKASELKAVEAELAALDDKLKAIIAERDGIQADARSSEERIHALEREADALGLSAQNAREKAAVMEAELGALRQQLGGFSAFLPDGEDQSVSGLEARLKSVEHRIERLGGVSEAALAHYEEREAEYGATVERRSVIEKEKQVILQTMAELEQRKREVFLEAFRAVREHYSRVVSSIEGWSGDLALEDEADPLAGGLVLTADPAGKRLVRLESMSGGERVLTAFCFLLALQKYDGAPFLVLDEVDAALDKVNCERLTEMMLRETGAGSQLIAVTHHNESMMRAAQQLIGVSARNGQSMLVGVNLDAYAATAAGAQ